MSNIIYRTPIQQNINQSLRHITRPAMRDTEISNISFNEIPSIFNHFLSNNPINFDNLTPVIVRPTRGEIINATENIEWNVDIGVDICPITRETFNCNDTITRIHHCGHCFNIDAINQWFTQNVCCPVCRYDIRTYQNEPIHDSSNNNIHDSSNNNIHDSSNNDIHDSSNNDINNLIGHDLMSSITSQINNSISQNYPMFINRNNNVYDTSNNNTSNNNTSNNNTSNNTDDEVLFEYIIQTPDTLYTSSNNN